MKCCTYRKRVVTFNKRHKYVVVYHMFVLLGMFEYSYMGEIMKETDAYWLCLISFFQRDNICSSRIQLQISIDLGNNYYYPSHCCYHSRFWHRYQFLNMNTYRQLWQIMLIIFCFVLTCKAKYVTEINWSTFFFPLCLILKSFYSSLSILLTFFSSYDTITIVMSLMETCINMIKITLWNLH